MSEVWDTKDGRRRVRRDPPTIDDAALAAQGLSEDLDAGLGGGSKAGRAENAAVAR